MAIHGSTLSVRLEPIGRPGDDEEAAVEICADIELELLIDFQIRSQIVHPRRMWLLLKLEIELPGSPEIDVPLGNCRSIPVTDTQPHL